jgi:hypothetical protein
MGNQLLRRGRHRKVTHRAKNTDGFARAGSSDTINGQVNTSAVDGAWYAPNGTAAQSFDALHGLFVLATHGRGCR